MPKEPSPQDVPNHLLLKPTCSDFAGVLGVHEARLRESPQSDEVVSQGLQWSFNHSSDLAPPSQTYLS